MKLNENTKLIGNEVVFVPYKKHHVEKYHKWMENEELLEQTASEPLNLNEEYEMQYKWWIDEDKCTFIVLSIELFKECTNVNTKDIISMVGDVNLFLNNPDDKSEAELEVMIAESNARRKGFGKEAVKMMMYYGVKFISIKTYIVKIGDDNKESINMFVNLGFQVQSHSEVFHETTYYLSCSCEDFQHSVINEIGSYIQVERYLCS